MDVDTKTAPSGPQKASTPSSENAKTSKTPSGKVLAKQNQKRTMWKNAFDNPFTVSWDPISAEAMQQVVGALSSVLKEMPPRKRHPEIESDESQKQKFGEVVVGLNEVTRGLEKDELRLVICTRDLSPSRVIQHIPVLCAMRSVPLCPLNMSPQAIAELMGASGIRTVICMGFKRTANESEWDAVVKSISSKCPHIDVPWVSFSDSSSTVSSSTDGDNPSKHSVKAKRQIELAKLKVRKIQHTAPVKPPKAKPIPMPSTKPAKTAATNK